MGGQPLPVYGLLALEKVVDERLAREYRRGVDYDQEELAFCQEIYKITHTNDQRQVYAFLEILERGNDSNKNNNNIILLDVLSGIGNAYLINLILSKIGSQGKIVLATASSGIAATFLQGGRTFHGTFKIPLDTYKMDQPKQPSHVTPTKAGLFSYRGSHWYHQVQSCPFNYVAYNFQ